MISYELIMDIPVNIMISGIVSSIPARGSSWTEASSQGDAAAGGHASPEDETQPDTCLPLNLGG